MSVANVVMFEFETSEDLESWAEWYKNNGPFPQQEINVFVKYLDLKQGVSFRESIDDTTGISSKIVIDWSVGDKPYTALCDYMDTPHKIY